LISVLRLEASVEVVPLRVKLPVLGLPVAVQALVAPVLTAVKRIEFDPLVIVIVPLAAGSPEKAPVALATVGVAVKVIELELAGLAIVIVWPDAVVGVPDTVPVCAASVPAVPAKPVLYTTKSLPQLGAPMGLKEYFAGNMSAPTVAPLPMSMLQSLFSEFPKPPPGHTGVGRPTPMVAIAAPLRQ